MRSEPRSAALLDEAEAIRDRFDEACEHAAREAGPTAGIALGPLVTLKMDELTPGTLGWRREVRASADETTAEPWGALGATVAPAGAAAGDAPEWLVGSARGGDASERVVRAVADGPPRVFLWFEAGNDRARERLESVLDRVEDLYRSESDAD